MTRHTFLRLALRLGAVLLIAGAAFLAARLGGIPLSALYGQEEAAEADPDASDSGGPPVQPIDFSHARHVEQARIDCQFCHAYARRGPVAGIPSVQRCAGCHETILPDAPEILKVLDYWENGTAHPLGAGS